MKKYLSAFARIAFVDGCFAGTSVFQTSVFGISPRIRHFLKITHPFRHYHRCRNWYPQMKQINTTTTNTEPFAQTRPYLHNSEDRILADRRCKSNSKDMTRDRIWHLPSCGHHIIQVINCSSRFWIILQYSWLMLTIPRSILRELCRLVRAYLRVEQACRPLMVRVRRPFQSTVVGRLVGQSSFCRNLKFSNLPRHLIL